MWSIILLLVNFACLATAATYNVDVGRTGPNFSPNTLQNIAIGDIVNFHFYPSNHSVAESTFDKPCKPKSGGVDAKSIFSGFVPVDDGVASHMWSMPINTTDPIWLYCSQGEHQHCRNGQSMVINPLSDSDQTLDAYMEAALQANVSSPSVVFGGVLLDNDDGSADSGSRASPTSSLRASMTETAPITIQPTSVNGATPAAASYGSKLGAWILLVVVFFATL